MHRTRRMYLLDGQIIDSKDCGGFVHTARKDHTDVYGNTIKKGEHLVRFNYYAMGNEVISLEDYVKDHDEGQGVILGVRTGKARGPWGTINNAVICARFFKPTLSNKTSFFITMITTITIITSKTPTSKKTLYFGRLYLMVESEW